MKPETKFRKNQVIPFLRTLPHCYAMPIQQVGICGDPDFVLCIRGHFVPLELKSQGDKVRPLQRHKLNKMKKAGATPLVASPDNWASVKPILLEMSEGEFSWEK